MTTVTIVQITDNGSDEAVYVDDMMILTADPGCGDCVETISTVAASLASMYRCKVQTVEHAAHDCWQWDEVEAELVAAGKIKPAQPTPIVIDVIGGCVGNVFADAPVVIRDFDADDGEDVPSINGLTFNAGVTLLDSNPLAKDDPIVLDAIKRLDTSEGLSFEEFQNTDKPVTLTLSEAGREYIYTIVDLWGNFELADDSQYEALSTSDVGFDDDGSMKLELSGMQTEDGQPYPYELGFEEHFVAKFS